MRKINILMCDDCMITLREMKEYIYSVYPEKFNIDMVSDQDLIWMKNTTYIFWI